MLEYTDREIAYRPPDRSVELSKLPEPEDEVRSSPPPIPDRIVEYNNRVDELLPPAPEAPPPPDVEKIKEMIETDLQAYEMLKNKVIVSPSPENASEAVQMLASAAQKSEQLHTSKTIFDYAVDAARGFMDAVSAFGRGIMYGIYGPPPEEDLRDEIAALKAVGTAAMSAGVPAAAVAAATGVGAPVAAVVGLGSLLGWALTDNFAGRLEFIQSQREAQKRHEERLQKETETWKKAREEYLDAWERSQLKILEEKKALEEEKRKFYEELEKERERRHKEERELWEEIEKKRQMREEEKKAEEAEERQFYALLQQLKSRAESVKGILSAASNAWFAKNGAQALELLNQAKSELQALDQLIDENSEILQKNGYFVAFKDQVRSIMNVISANEKAWTGQNPNRDLSNATTNYTNSTKSFNRTTAKNMKRLGPADPADPILQSMLRKAFKIDTNNVAIGMLLAQLAQQLLQYIPMVELPRSKLPSKTIVKLRLWLKRQYRTPLAMIPNSVWNENAGYRYTPLMIRLIHRAMRDAKVSPNELKGLKLRDLEAIFRARQYIYAAARRGYFEPYEFELYTRLKEHLYLTDEEARKLFKLAIPTEVMKEVEQSVAG